MIKVGVTIIVLISLVGVLFISRIVFEGYNPFQSDEKGYYSEATSINFVFSQPTNFEIRIPIIQDENKNAVPKSLQTLEIESHELDNASISFILEKHQIYINESSMQKNVSIYFLKIKGYALNFNLYSYYKQSEDTRISGEGTLFSWDMPVNSSGNKTPNFDFFVSISPDISVEMTYFFHSESNLCGTSQVEYNNLWGVMILEESEISTSGWHNANFEGFYTSCA